MTQELVQAETKEMTAYAPPDGGWADDGNADIAPAFPIVSILQPMSQVVNAVAGWFHHSDTDEIASDFDCVPLVKRETRAMFVDNDDKPICRSDDGIVPAPRQRLWNMEAGIRVKVNGASLGVPPVTPRDCANCPFSDWNGAEPPVCGNSYQIIVARNGDPDDLVQLRLKGTSIKPYRDFVRKKLAPRRIPMFFFQFHLTTEEKTAPSRKWYQLVIDAAPLTENDARTYSEVISQHRARIETAVKEAGGEVEEWVDDGAFE